MNTEFHNGTLKHKHYKSVKADGGNDNGNDFVMTINQ